MNLSPEQRRYLLLGQCLVPFALNFLINGVLGIVMFRGVDPVPTWGTQAGAAGPDLIGTCFFLPAITCLIVTPLVHRHVRRGVVARAAGLGDALERFQRPLLRRALRFGLAGLLPVGGALAIALVAVGPGEWNLTEFLWVKAAFSAVLGGVVTPIIGLVALADAVPLPQPA